jgi:vancomycin resistance protein YoaR
MTRAMTAEPLSVPAPDETSVETSVGLVHPHRLRVRFLVAFAIGLLAVLGVGVGALYAYDQQYQDRILPGVRVADVDLSGLTPADAAARLHAAYDRFGKGHVVLVADGKRLTITYDQIHREAAVDSMVERAMAVGRSGNPVERAIANARTAVNGVALTPQVGYDHDALTRWVTSLAEAQDRTPADAMVSLSKTAYAVTDSVTGRQADPAPALASLAETLTRLDAPAEVTLELPFTTIEPFVTTAEANDAVVAANRVAQNVTIRDGDDHWTIPAATIRGWIEFRPTPDGGFGPIVDTSQVDEALRSVTADVARSPKNASFRTSGAKVVGVLPSTNGRALDGKATAARVAELFAARAAGGTSTDVQAVVATTAPSLTTAEAEAFAPKMRPISSFSVYYFVIVNNHWGGNIEAPATKINGTVVPAGGIFDFWKVVGDLRKLPGEGPGNAIEGGKITVTGAFGGGICTTSTTLFNAAFRAGMVPLARQNHNEFINRYPPGLDATVWIIGKTKQTMSFRNDTKYPILITRTITNAGSRRWITFKIWSVPNGRTYKISNLVIHPGPRAIDTVVKDPTKPVGYTFRNNSPVDGAKVWVTVTIYDHGKIHWTQRYFSNYPAVNGVLVVGTKT